MVFGIENSFGNLNKLEACLRQKNITFAPILVIKTLHEKSSKLLLKAVLCALPPALSVCTPIFGGYGCGGRCGAGNFCETLGKARYA